MEKSPDINFSDRFDRLEMLIQGVMLEVQKVRDQITIMNDPKKRPKKRSKQFCEKKSEQMKKFHQIVREHTKNEDVSIPKNVYDISHRNENCFQW